jgi:hypothetical protein
VSGAALLGLSLLLSVGPALAANNNSNGNGGNNGNAASTNGTLKVHDAATGVESGGNGNEPHVCDFWLSFLLDAPFEAGTWVVVSWAPTGDGSTVASGLYDTSGDGVDSSSVIDVPAGHYRVEWAAVGASVSNKKTLWVDADCDAPVTPVDEPPTEDASPTEDEPPTEDASPTEDVPPTEDASPAEDLPPTEELTPADDESPVEESVAADEESPSDDSTPTGDESVLGSEGSSTEDPGLPAEEPADEDPADEDPGVENPGSPSDESPATPGDPSDEEEAAHAVDTGDADPPTPPEQNNNLVGVGTSDEPTMADTATPSFPVSSGIAATFGLLMLIVVHATARRGKRSASRA